MKSWDSEFSDSWNTAACGSQPWPWPWHVALALVSGPSPSFLTLGSTHTLRGPEQRVWTPGLDRALSIVPTTSGGKQLLLGHQRGEQDDLGPVSLLLGSQDTTAAPVCSQAPGKRLALPF